jgi:hypothetical protein
MDTLVRPYSECQRAVYKMFEETSAFANLGSMDATQGRGRAFQGSVKSSEAKDAARGCLRRAAAVDSARRAAQATAGSEQASPAAMEDWVLASRDAAVERGLGSGPKRSTARWGAAWAVVGAAAGGCSVESDGGQRARVAVDGATGATDPGGDRAMVDWACAGMLDRSCGGEGPGGPTDARDALVAEVEVAAEGLE